MEQRELGGMGAPPGDRLGYKLSILGTGRSRPDRMGRGGGGEKGGEGGSRWRITSENYRDPPPPRQTLAACDGGLAPSDQLQASLKPSLDFDLLEGVYSGDGGREGKGKKGNSGRNGGGWE